MYFVAPFDTATVMAHLVAITWFMHVLENCQRFWILCMQIVKIKPIKAHDFATQCLTNLPLA